MTFDASLEAEFPVEEFKHAVWSLDDDKAPGSDRFLIFFKKFRISMDNHFGFLKRSKKG